MELFRRADPNLDVDRIREQIDALARDAAPSVAAAPGPREKVRALNHFFFELRGFRGDLDLEDPDNLFPDRVLERRRGYCTGLATIYVGVAERLGLPVHGVNTPAHLFLRYDDGLIRINIETLEAGREISDETYRLRYRIPESSVEAGVFLRSLPPNGFLSQLVNNLGVLESRTSGTRESILLFQEAIDLDPRNVTATFNLARERMVEGNLADALAGFNRALDLNPSDVASLTNRGAVRLQLGDRDGAVADFLAALAIDPGAAEARRNLEAVLGAPPGRERAPFR